MCGFAGILNLDGAPADREVLVRMGDLLAHRGPDDSGLVVEGPLGLVHRRLSIHDLSERGRQPMVDGAGRRILVFNGEIYNFKELRTELEAAGHRFRSSTDTEVLLEAHARWGRACLPRLAGMFAFAVWDRAEHKLLLGRDRFGIKPLYILRTEECLLFASEIKAFFAHPGFHAAMNTPRVFDFLAYGWLDHTAETMFDGVEQLPPAHSLEVVDSAKRGLHRYWCLPEEPADPRRLPSAEEDAEAGDRFEAAFRRSVLEHLQSDVPVGTCLSGGLDSSSIVCMIDRLRKESSEGLDGVLGPRPRTFSSVFEGEACDESDHIAAVNVATDSMPHRVTPTGEGLLRDLEDLLWHQEEPFYSTSIYAQWCVMRTVGPTGVKVLLDGQGADEILAGYHGYYAFRLADLLAQGRVFEWLREREGYRKLHGQAYPWLPPRELRGLVPEAVADGFVRGYRARRSGMAEELLRAHVDHDPPPACVAGARSRLDRQLRTVLGSRGLPSLLHYEDRNSMAFSLEARVPFLDHRLVELMYELPATQKLRRGATKVVLRRALRDLLPPSIRDRADKLGFETPEASWLRGPAGTLMDDLLSSSRARERGLLDLTYIRNLWVRRGWRPVRGDYRAWRWIVLELWARMFLDGRPARAREPRLPPGAVPTGTVKSGE